MYARSCEIGHNGFIALHDRQEDCFVKVVVKIVDVFVHALPWIVNTHLVIMTGWKDALRGKDRFRVIGCRFLRRVTGAGRQSKYQCRDEGAADAPPVNTATICATLSL